MATKPNEALEILRDLEGIKYNDVPVLLLCKIKPLLEDPTTTSSELWGSGLMEKLVLVLGWDFLKVHGQWQTAAQFALLWIEMIGTHPVPKYDAFLRDRIASTEPKSFTRLISEIIFQRLHAHNSKDQKMLKSLRTVLQAVITRTSDSPDLSARILSDEKMLHWLEWNDRFLSDEPLHELILSFLLSLVESLKRTSLNQASLWRLHFTLLPHTRHSNSRKAIRLILSIYISSLQHSDVSYRRKFKRAIGESVLEFSKTGDDNIEKLRRELSHTQEEIPETAPIQDLEKEVTKVQALWRGHRARVRLAKAKSGFVQLQQLFRHRLKEKKKCQEMAEAQANKKWSKIISGTKESRRLGQLRMEAIDALPKGQLNYYLEEEAKRAATVVQSYWRGYKARKDLSEAMLKERRAAQRIQRFLWKCVARRRRQLSTLNEWPPMKKEEQERYEDEIGELSANVNSREKEWELQELNAALVATQKALHDHRKLRPQQLQSYQRRALLLAKLESDTYLLENAPAPSKVTAEEIGRYHSFNAAVKARAADLHREQKRKMAVTEALIFSDHFPVLNSL